MTGTPASRAASPIESVSWRSSAIRKSFFENEGGGERERLRANYCDVVDRAVYGERADVAAGESERAYHEGVGG